ncbi:hypothetical protein ILFOPFJJ_04859 [Ensifer psoraleae]|nr:hypothetical protein [Sinorhizobium psoraleae]
MTCIQRLDVAGDTSEAGPWNRAWNGRALAIQRSLSRPRTWPLLDSCDEHRNEGALRRPALAFIMHGEPIEHMRASQAQGATIPFTAQATAM